MNLYAETANLVTSLVGHEYLYFDNALEVKKTPHSLPARMWAVSVSPAGEIYLMDADEQWHTLETDSDLILNTLHQRVKPMTKTFC